MSKQLKYASAISICLTLVTTIFTAAGSRAAVQDPQVPVIEAQGASPVIFPSRSAAPVQQAAAQQAATHSAMSTVDAPETDVPESLAELVDETAVPAALSSELNCLAGAIYFEAKSETLDGQLAVGRVVVERSKSGRFPASYCGVVYQPSQFSFVRGHAMPPINKGSRDRAEAVKIAQIADKGAWKSPAEGAMYFHAARVSPRWGKVRLARVDNHIFYR